MCSSDLLTGSRGAEQNDVLLPRTEALGQLGDRRGLVPAGRIGTDDLEGLGYALKLGNGTHALRLRGPADILEITGGGAARVTSLEPYRHHTEAPLWPVRDHSSKFAHYRGARRTSLRPAPAFTVGRSSCQPHPLL